MGGRSALETPEVEMSQDREFNMVEDFAVGQDVALRPEAFLRSRRGPKRGRVIGFAGSFVTVKFDAWPMPMAVEPNDIAAV
jgi:hypothetical protein